MSLLHRFLCASMLLLLSGHIESNAQKEFKEPALPVITLRANPLSFLETDCNVTLGVGYQWHRRWAFTFDPGYIFFAPYSSTTDGERNQVSGIKIRTDVRFFFEKSRSGGFNTFIAPEFHYKYVTTKKWDDFGFNCVGGQCDYYQLAQYKEVKRETGAGVKLGTVLPLSGSRFSVELYGGIGVKFKKFKETDIPIGGSFVNEPDRDGFFNNTQEGVGYLILPAGAKIVFRL